MNAVATRQPRPLTEQQQRFVDELVTSGSTPTEAARRADFAAPGQEAYRLMRKPHVLTAIREERERVISGTLCNIALKTLAEIMQDGELPASARVAACRVAVEMGGYFDKGARNQDDDKAIHEMSEAELQGFIVRSQAIVAAGGDAPILSITGAPVN